MATNNQSTGGIGFLGLLTICFIVLKLCGVITWRWLWVLAPLWMPVVCVGIVLLVVLLVWTLPALFGWRK